MPTDFAIVFINFRARFYLLTSQLVLLRFAAN